MDINEASDQTQPLTQNTETLPNAETAQTTAATQNSEPAPDPQTGPTEQTKPTWQNPPPQQAGSNGPGWQKPKPTATAAFWDSIYRLNLYRHPDRFIGGVSGAIATRFNIDRTLVRGLFVLFTVFSGLGAVLYALAWLLLPEPDGRIHLRELFAGRPDIALLGILFMLLASGATTSSFFALGPWSLFNDAWVTAQTGAMLSGTGPAGVILFLLMAAYIIGLAVAAVAIWKHKDGVAWALLGIGVLLSVFCLVVGFNFRGLGVVGLTVVLPGTLCLYGLFYVVRALGQKNHTPLVAPVAPPSGTTPTPGTTPSPEAPSPQAPAWSPNPASTQAFAANPLHDQSPYMQQAYAQQTPYLPTDQPSKNAKPQTPGPHPTLTALIWAGILLLTAGAFLTYQLRLPVLYPLLWAAAVVILLGLGMVISAVQGRRGGWMNGLAIPLLICVVLPLGVASTVIGSDMRLIGNPIIANDIVTTSGHSATIGEITLDLRETKLQAGKEYPLDLVIGDAQVLLPEDQNIIVQAELTMGELNAQIPSNWIASDSIAGLDLYNSRSWTNPPNQFLRDGTSYTKTTYTWDGMTGSNLHFSSKPGLSKANAAIVKIRVGMGELNIETSGNFPYWQGFRLKDGHFVQDHWVDRNGAIQDPPMPGTEDRYLSADDYARLEAQGKAPEILTDGDAVPPAPAPQVPSPRVPGQKTPAPAESSQPAETESAPEPASTSTSTL